MVAAEQVADLRKWLTASAPQGLADGPFRFRHLRGLHFAKLLLIEQTDDLEGRPIPASLVLMTEVDAPLRRHLDDLATELNPHKTELNPHKAVPGG